MKLKIPKTLDAPDKQNVGAVLIFSFFAFFTVTFLMTLMGIGLEKQHTILSWFEIGFHLLCLVVVVPLMREYLSFSWYTACATKKQILTWCAVGAGTLLVYGLWSYVMYWITGEMLFDWMYEFSLPVMTNYLYLTNNYTIFLNPVFGTVCAVVVAPLTTSCIFYATAFAKGYNVRPWLGYLLVTALLLFPRLATGLTGWWQLDLTPFLMQLPVHLVCCWAYQETDNIWTPIFIQSAANLVACLMIIFVI